MLSNAAAGDALFRHQNNVIPHDLADELFRKGEDLHELVNITGDVFRTQQLCRVQYILHFVRIADQNDLCARRSVEVIVLLT